MSRVNLVMDIYSSLQCGLRILKILYQEFCVFSPCLAHPPQLFLPVQQHYVCLHQFVNQEVQQLPVADLVRAALLQTAAPRQTQTAVPRTPRHTQVAAPRAPRHTQTAALAAGSQQHLSGGFLQCCWFNCTLQCLLCMMHRLAHSCRCCTVLSRP